MRFMTAALLEQDEIEQVLAVATIPFPTHGLLLQSVHLVAALGHCVVAELL